MQVKCNYKKHAALCMPINASPTTYLSLEGEISDHLSKSYCIQHTLLGSLNALRGASLEYRGEPGIKHSQRILQWL